MQLGSGSRPKDGKPELGVKSVAQMMCMYTNARSTANKQEELEAMVQQQSYNVVAIMDKGWDDSHTWSTALDGYKLFRRDRKSERGDFNLQDICWELKTSEKKQYRKFFECVEDNFLLQLVDGVGEKNGPPVIQEEAVRELLRCLDVHKSMGPDGIHPGVMRELAELLGKRSPPDGPWDIVILGDTFHGPTQNFVLPEMQTVLLGQEIFVNLCCTDTPFYLSQETPIAKAFLLPQNHMEWLPLNPKIMWAQIMGSDKPIIECCLFCKGEKIHRPGMLDTGADVTIIARSEWPANGELQPVAGMISGIGGITVSMQSKQNIIVKGPERNLATIRPFMFSGMPLSLDFPSQKKTIKDSVEPLHRASQSLISAQAESKHNVIIEGPEGNLATICPFVDSKTLPSYANDKNYLNKAVTSTIETIQKAGFEIREDKVQYTSPWKYLGLQIRERTIFPQQLTIRDGPKALRDLHSLCGSINWKHPLLGITREDLTPLFNLLRGNEGLDSPRTITPEAREAITKVQEALSSRQAHGYEPSLPFQFSILGKAPHFHGLIFQQDSQLTDPLLILEWVFMSNQPTKTISTFQEIMAHPIRKVRTLLRSLAGCEFTCIYLPLTTGDLEHLLQTNESLQFALDSYTGQISIHLPKHKLSTKMQFFI
ncbi:hypothetical protein TURU_086012 [Turdus rufiventris]|nr:hypothetical protein TURU_086012 [Turdus rufiventris]